MATGERVVSLAALRDSEAARMDAACIRCGACFAACPMVPFSAAKNADPVGAVDEGGMAPIPPQATPRDAPGRLRLKAARAAGRDTGGSPG